MQEAPQQQEALSKASSNEADHGDEAAFVDVSERNDDDYIDEELDEGNYSDKHQDQGEEKEQGDSNQVDAEETDDIDSGIIKQELRSPSSEPIRKSSDDLQNWKGTCWSRVSQLGLLF